MIKKTIYNIEFDIEQIMQDTPQYMIGTSKADYATVFVFGFVQADNYYAVYAAFDTNNDCNALVVIDDNDTVINQIKGANND